MGKRENILEHLNENEKLFAVRIIDYVEQVEKSWGIRYTQFLDPSQVVKAEKIIKQCGSSINYFVTSGIEDCERNIIVISHDSIDAHGIVLPIAPILLDGNFKFEILHHRDVLGAIMNLGIKREKMGDIFFSKDKCYVIVYEDICDYISINLTRIKHVPIDAKRIDFDQLPPREISTKEMKATISSPRLDSVISAGFGVSRSSISKEIKNGNVKVNYEEIKTLSFSVNEGDVISLRGRGRISIKEMGGLSKKGRINITILKYI